MPHFLKEMLNKELTSEKVIKATEDTKSGKSPGADGLIARFYKLIKNEVGVYLKQVMNSIMMNTQMSSSWNQASISFIHKDNSDLTNV